MVAKVLSSLVRGLEGRLVEVQVDISSGPVGFALVGLATGSVREAKERVRSAIRNSGLPFPAQRKLTVNLAPAELRKEGSGLDLAIGVGISLAALGLPSPGNAAFLGELSLDGAVRHVDGVLVAARWLASRGVAAVFVPEPDAAEAALAGGLRVYSCPSLAAAMTHLMGDSPLEPYAVSLPAPPPEDTTPEHDLAEVQGQDSARRALELAASGGTGAGADPQRAWRPDRRTAPRMGPTLPGAASLGITGGPHRRRFGRGHAWRDQQSAPRGAVHGRAGRVPQSYRPGAAAAARA